MHKECGMAIKELWRLVNVCSLSFVFVACGSNESLESQTKVRNAELSFHNNIPVFYSQDGRCTASYINQEPPVVLTARHCVERSWQENQGKVPEGHRAYFIFQDQVDAETINAVEYFYPEKKFLEFGPFMIPNDYALLRLASAPKANMRPYTLAEETPKFGQPMRVVGYGQSDCKGIIKGKDNAAIQRELNYKWGINFNVCPGDSGGPHFNENNEVIAVSSAVGLFGESHMKIAKHRDAIYAQISKWSESL